jgi:hypothetical protein
MTVIPHIVKRQKSAPAFSHFDAPSPLFSAMKTSPPVSAKNPTIFSALNNANSVKENL